MGLGGSRAAVESQPDSVYWAAYFGRVVELRLMLDRGADVNQRESEYHRTPLIATAFKDRWEAALLLLERGANIELREESLGCTALMIAAQYNSLGVAQVLLEANADPNAGNDQHGQTALMWCCQYDHAQMASQLISRGASVSQQRRDTVTPLMIAAKNNAYSVAALLLDSGADPNLVGNGRFTALMICAMVDSLEVAQLLLRQGAEKAALNRDGKTALLLCAENGSLRVAQLLLDSGADPDVTSQESRHTAATVATARGHLDLLRLLVEHGANFRHRCVDGSGLLELAAVSGSQPMMTYVRRLIGETMPHQVAATAELHWVAPGKEQQQQQQPRHQSNLQPQQTAQQVKQQEEVPRSSYAATLEIVAVAGTASAEPETKAGADAIEDTVIPKHVRPLGPNTFVPFEEQQHQTLDDHWRAEAGQDYMPEEDPISWEDQMNDSDDDAAESEVPEDAVAAIRVQPLGPDSAVPHELQLLGDQKTMVAVEEESAKEAKAVAVVETAAEPEKEAEAGADAALAEEAVNDDAPARNWDSLAAEEAIGAWESLAGLGACGKTFEAEAGEPEAEEVAEEAVAAISVRPLGPDTAVSFEQQQLDDQKRLTAESLSSNDEAKTEKEEVVEESVKATYLRPLGPDTGVPFEQQLLDDHVEEASAEEKTEAVNETQVTLEATVMPSIHGEAVHPDAGSASWDSLAAEKANRAWESLAGLDAGEGQKTPEGELAAPETPRNSSSSNDVPQADEEEVVVESVEATHLRPLGPDTAVSFEQQLLDDERRSEATVEIVEEDSVNASVVTEAEPETRAKVEANKIPEAEEPEAEEVAEEAVAPISVRPLGPDTAVPFEQQQLDDQKRLAVESHNSSEDCEASGKEEVVEESVEATHLRPLGPNTAVSLEQQLLDDQRLVEETTVSESVTASSSNAVFTARTSQRQQQKKQAAAAAATKNYPNKKYTVTKRMVTTETTGKQVSKREQIVKISINRGDLSESVCQTEGPPQTVKWTSRRDTETQFQK